MSSAFLNCIRKDVWFCLLEAYWYWKNKLFKSGLELFFQNFIPSFRPSVAPSRNHRWKIEWFSNDCRKTKTKAITSTNNNSSKQRDEPITIPSNFSSNSLKAPEISRLRGAIGFGFACYWLKNWRESFTPITKRSNGKHVFAFVNHVKTVL